MSIFIGQKRKLLRHPPVEFLESWVGQSENDIL